MMSTEKDTQVKSTSEVTPLPSPPPLYSSSGSVLIIPTALATAPSQHLHAPLSAEQDIQYHQLFSTPSTAVDLKNAVLPVAKLIETYRDDGEIKSNDPKLSDAIGSHTETEVYYTYRTNPHNNMREQVRQTRTTTITDFSFNIPLLPFASVEAPHITLWTLEDKPEANPLPLKLRETEKWKRSNGLPGWADPTATRDLYNIRNPTDQVALSVLPLTSVASSPLQSPAMSEGKKDLEVGVLNPLNSLRDVCERYVKDQGSLKVIEMKVELYGWDTDKMTEAIENCIRATGYHSSVVVLFSSMPKSYIVRPFNSLTKLKRNFWLMVLACVTLVYPVIWLILRASGQKGGKYKSIRADLKFFADALKTYRPVEGTFPGESLAQAHTRLHPHSVNATTAVDNWAHRDLVTGPAGVYILHGMKEGTWLRTWEERIAEAARNRFQGDLQDGVVAGRVMGSGLDGY